jgi:hypothetical protein
VTQSQEEKEIVAKVQALQKMREKKARRLQKILHEAKLETLREATMHNATMTLQRTHTPKHDVDKADVFHFRPATSHSDIRCAFALLFSCF